MRKAILIAVATFSVGRLALFASAENNFDIRRKRSGEYIYIHLQANWPHFTWRQDSMVTLLAAAPSLKTLIGRMEALGSELGADVMLVTLTEDVVNPAQSRGKGRSTIYA
jgi:prolyl oligopeptidase PreP (S9A serine peptidase family)